ncbi:MAG: biopolymer transporter ExbD [Bacteroidetes bacterium]|nr:MAG: biopolymer transporter ExbD [Bacteroidota bacterium]
MADVGGGAPRGHDKKKKKKKMRRIGIRIDMTPMVDVAFLLLTFFIMTTTMSRPQTMEINLPPEEKIEVAQSNVLTLRVKEDGTIFWNISDEKPEKVTLSKLRETLEQKVAQNPKMITVIKIDRKGKYTMMVDIMDELNLANITRFSLAKMEEADLKILDQVTG